MSKDEFYQAVHPSNEELNAEIDPDLRHDYPRDSYAKWLALPVIAVALAGCALTYGSGNAPHADIVEVYEANSQGMDWTIYCDRTNHMLIYVGTDDRMAVVAKDCGQQ